MSVSLLIGCATSQPSGGARQTASSVASDVTAVSLEAQKGLCKSDLGRIEKTKTKDLMGEANVCAASGKWKSVEAIGQELALRDVQSPWGAYYLSLVAEADDKMERAIWLSDLASKKAPNVGLFHYQRARILWKKEDFKLATEALQKSITLDTNLIDAHLFLGQIFFRDQDYSKAARHFQAVIRVRPKDPTALMGLAECHIQTSDAKGALDYLERGDRAFPSEPTFQVRMAVVHETLLNDVPRALEIYRRVAAGYESGKYSRSLDFSLAGKIQDLELSVRGNRAVAGSSSSAEVAK